MPTYKVTSNFKSNGVRHEVGEVLELDEATAAPLVEAGLVEASDGSVAEVGTPLPPLVPSAPAGQEPALTGTPTQDPTQIAPHPHPVPDGFPLQPSAEQIARDIDSIEGSAL